MTPMKLISATLLVAIAALPAAAPSLSSELEEERPFVGSIEFLGNENISEGKLKSVMRTREAGFFQLFNKPRFRADFLRYDIAAIEALYHKHGYYEAFATVAENRYEDDNSVHIVIRIYEGEQTIVKDVTIEGELTFNAERVVKGLHLKAGAPFDSTLVGTDVYYIRNRLWDDGRILADIGSSVELRDHEAYLTYTVVPGPPMRVGDIEVRGNRVANEKRIRARLTFDQGEVFSLRKIHESQQHLFDTSLFRQVNLSASRIDTLGREVDLLVEVEERKMSYVELGLGIGTEDNGRIAAEWGHRHLPWLGGKLQVETEHA